ncbi:hypothetical protein EBS_0019 [endosymbiont of unidentified scaly snail isolate Monju]|nr:hypothetical protein EBS_0019 [endosymbiont of unidentified scaly snail isolate Monju]
MLHNTEVPPNETRVALDRRRAARRLHEFGAVVALVAATSGCQCSACLVRGPHRGVLQPQQPAHFLHLLPPRRPGAATTLLVVSRRQLARVAGRTHLPEIHPRALPSHRARGWRLLQGGSQEGTGCTLSPVPAGQPPAGEGGLLAARAAIPSLNYRCPAHAGRDRPAIMRAVPAPGPAPCPNAMSSIATAYSVPCP